MALFTDKLVLAFPPKTGSKWYRAVLDHAGLLRADTGIHQIPGSELENFGDMAIAVGVRHPSEWLRSYFANMIGRAIGVRSVDRLQECFVKRRKNFEQFLQHYLQNMAGQASRIFEEYADRTDFVLKLENGAGGLIDVLKQAGHDVDEGLARVIAEVEPQHVSAPRNITWPPVLLEAFEKSEQAYDQYGYIRRSMRATESKANT